MLLSSVQRVPKSLQCAETILMGPLASNMFDSMLHAANAVMLPAIYTRSVSATRKQIVASVFLSAHFHLAASAVLTGVAALSSM